MLKMWILVLHQASEQLWTKEDQKGIMVELSTFHEEDLEQVSNHSRLMYTRPIDPYLVNATREESTFFHSLIVDVVSASSCSNQAFRDVCWCGSADWRKDEARS